MGYKWIIFGVLHRRHASPVTACVLRVTALLMWTGGGAQLWAVSSVRRVAWPWGESAVVAGPVPVDMARHTLKQAATDRRFSLGSLALISILSNLLNERSGPDTCIGHYTAHGRGMASSYELDPRARTHCGHHLRESKS